MNNATLDGKQGPREEEPVGSRIQDLVPPIWAARKPIALITLGVTVLAFVVNYFVLPRRYTAIATLLPETEKSKLSTLSQFADIAQLAGVSIPGSEIARLYPAIVVSETILRNVIEKPYKTNKFPAPVNLIQYFELADRPPGEAMDAALKVLRNSISASFDNRTNIVTITAEMREPQLAADVLNATIDELDKFMREKKITNASEQRKWVEERLKEVEGQLKTSEENLKAFREQNRRVMDSPQLLMEQERLMREVQINSTLFIELKKQYELAKIEEIKNITIVNILDRARAPVDKSGPNRSGNTALMFLLAAVCSSGYVAARAVYGSRIREFLKSLKSNRRGVSAGTHVAEKSN
jgi:uncharacterized protein involved in exopolysaccharide biosynthesis